MWRLFKDQGVEGWKEGGEGGGVSSAYWAPYSTLLSSGLFQERKRRGVRFFFSHSFGLVVLWLNTRLPYVELLTH